MRKGGDRGVWGRGEGGEEVGGVLGVGYNGLVRLIRSRRAFAVRVSAATWESPAVWEQETGEAESDVT